MALVKGLAKLSILLAKQTGKSQDEILGMLRKSGEGPLRRLFGKNPWFHATPEKIPKGKVVPFEAFKDARNQDVLRSDLVKQGTYLATDKKIAEKMGRRLMSDPGQEVGPTNMPFVLRKGTKFIKDFQSTIEREALRPRHVQNIPMGQTVNATKNIRNDFGDKILDALDPNEIKVLERYTGALGAKGTKAFNAYIKKTGGGRGFPGHSEVRESDSGFQLLDEISRHNSLPKHLRSRTSQVLGGLKDQFEADVASQLGPEYSYQLLKVIEKLGRGLPQIRKAALERWKKRGYSGFRQGNSLEANIWPGEEKKVLRHLLAEFKEEYGGITAGLLPLISLLRRKREE